MALPLRINGDRDARRFYGSRFQLSNLQSHSVACLIAHTHLKAPLFDNSGNNFSDRIL